MRHFNAYSTFVDEIFKLDPNNMMIAFRDMMKNKIVMPAMFLRESGDSMGAAFDEFSNSAQRIGVYTGQDYVDIMKRLIKRWDIENLTDLKEDGEKARDFVTSLPARMERVNQRIRIPEKITHFKWVNPALTK
jgi:acyl-[acyl-carrier-protein] desaturase